MPCTSPIEGYRTPSGALTQDKRKSNGNKVTVPCGRCIGCRLDYSRDWAVRITHELKFHDHACFITLTYAPEHLPKGGNLVTKHYQDFMKRLRKKFNVPIYYFHCGEYGEKSGRPHYHAILFGIDFCNEKFDPDTHVIARRDSGAIAYRSPVLNKLWGKGITEVGTATFKSAAYIARYITKKIHGEKAREHYDIIDVDSDTGEIEWQKPEYITMSKKIPTGVGDEKAGIGTRFFYKYNSDIFQNNKGRIIISHSPDSKPFECRVPRYYMKLLERTNPDKYLKVKQANLDYLKEKHNRERVNGKPTMESIEANILARSSKLKRNYEEN